MIPTFADSRPAPGARAIISVAAADAGLTIADILSHHRHAQIVAARQEAYLRLRQAGFSLSLIGLLMGRDHSTVIHGIRRATERNALKSEAHA